MPYGSIGVSAQLCVWAINPFKVEQTKNPAFGDRGRVDQHLLRYLLTKCPNTQSPTFARSLHTHRALKLPFKKHWHSMAQTKAFRKPAHPLRLHENSLLHASLRVSPQTQPSLSVTRRVRRCPVW